MEVGMTHLLKLPLSKGVASLPSIHITGHTILVGQLTLSKVFLRGLKDHLRGQTSLPPSI